MVRWKKMQRGVREGPQADHFRELVLTVGEEGLSGWRWHKASPEWSARGPMSDSKALQGTRELHLHRQWEADSCREPGLAPCEQSQGLERLERPGAQGSLKPALAGRDWILQPASTGQGPFLF